MKNLFIVLNVMIGLAAHATTIAPNPAAPGDLGQATNSFPNIYGANIVAGQVSASSFNGNAAALTNLTFRVWNLIVVGDSLSGTNGWSSNQSYPSLLQTLCGFTVLTNASFPGLTSGSVCIPEVDSVAPYCPTMTGQPSFLLIECGKNDEFAIAADLITLTNTANGIMTNIMIGCNKAWGMGAVPVVMTVHHTAFPPAGPPTFTNSEPVTIYVNQWITNLPNATNLTQGRKILVADVAAIYPQTLYTNANGTLNTNTTFDGEHLVGAAMIPEAAVIANAVTNSAVWKAPFPAPSLGLGGWVSNAPVKLPSGSGVQNLSPYGYGQIATFSMGSYSQPAYFEDAYWDQQGGTTQDIVGSGWVSGVDENTLATSGFRFMNKSRQYQLFVDTSDQAGLFGGATNFDKSLSYFGYPSLSWRGSIMLQPIPYQWYPNSCPNLQVALHDEWGIFKIGVNYNGTPGIAAFDGQTFTTTNLAAGQNISAGGIISGNGAGITNQASINWTNITMGQLYTNNTTHFWELTIPVVFTNAAAIGTNVIGLEVWRQGTSGYVVSKAGQITTASSPVGPCWDTLLANVPPGGSFAVTNLGILGTSGDTNGVDYGIGVTNMIQMY